MRLVGQWHYILGHPLLVSGIVRAVPGQAAEQAGIARSGVRRRRRIVVSIENVVPEMLPRLVGVCGRSRIVHAVDRQRSVHGRRLRVLRVRGRAVRLRHGRGVLLSLRAGARCQQHRQRCKAGARSSASSVYFFLCSGKHVGSLFVQPSAAAAICCCWAISCAAFASAGGAAAANAGVTFGACLPALVLAIPWSTVSRMWFCISCTSLRAICTCAARSHSSPPLLESTTASTVLSGFAWDTTSTTSPSLIMQRRPLGSTRSRSEETTKACVCPSVSSCTTPPAPGGGSLFWAFCCASTDSSLTCRSTSSATFCLTSGVTVAAASGGVGCDRAAAVL